MQRGKQNISGGRQAYRVDEATTPFGPSPPTPHAYRANEAAATLGVSPPIRRAYRVNEAAAPLGVSRSTLYKLMKPGGGLAWVQIAGFRAITPEAIDDLLAGGQK
jgi:hypothetical protein